MATVPAPTETVKGTPRGTTPSSAGTAPAAASGAAEGEVTRRHSVSLNGAVVVGGSPVRAGKLVHAELQAKVLKVSSQCPALTLS